MTLKTLSTILVLHLLLQSSASSSSSSSSSEDSGEQDSGEKHSKGSHWRYEEQDTWSSAFQDCSGKSQSPIDINTKEAIYDGKLPPITLDGYDLTDGPELTLWNNGHTLQLNLPNTMRIVTGFDTVYLAAQLHFHWGTVEVPGSEHTIDNVHFPAEIHVVHYNSKYPSIKEAATQPDGLAVLGGFIGVGLHENENYEKILSSLTAVSVEETDTEIQGFNVRHLLPNNLEKFYRYTGSLTTPPCFQTVNWTMFNDTITVSRKQLAALEETLKIGQTEHLNKNFRAPQLLYGRRVLTSFSSSPIPGGKAGLSITSSVKTDPMVDRHGAESSDAGSSSWSKGDILAMAFGALFVATLLLFTAYAYQQRSKYASMKKDPKQNVIYMPANKDEP